MPFDIEICPSAESPFVRKRMGDILKTMTYAGMSRESDHQSNNVTFLLLKNNLNHLIVPQHTFYVAIQSH